MCGRFTLRAPGKLLAEVLGLDQAPELPFRYNIAPTQPVATVRETSSRSRELAMRRWGLIPYWAKDPAIGNRNINARAETVAVKPAFRDGFRRRRCLVPADGFYEWRLVDGKKQPYLFSLRDGNPFAFAGLWERWVAADGELIESCTIITTEANDLVRPTHDRMPVILERGHFSRWLDPAAEEVDLQALLRPYPAEEMATLAVSTRVNNARNDDPACCEPAPAA